MWTRKPQCDRSARAFRDDAETQAHASGCEPCRDALAIAAWMRDVESRNLCALPAPPNPAYVWRKAQVLSRWDDERKAGSFTGGEPGPIGIVSAVMLAASAMVGTRDFLLRK